MATTRAKEPELPLEPIEPKPQSADEVKFDVAIYPWVAGADVYWLWKIVGNTHSPHVGDWTSLKGASYFETSEEAEADAKRMIENTRHVIELKLSAPKEYRITL